MRFGYKLWCLASTDGYLFHAEPYCGSSTNFSQTGLGQGGDVVLGLIEKANVCQGHTITMDNLFTSFDLFAQLTARGIGATGTVRENRLREVSFSNKKTFAKLERGVTEACVTDELLLVRWNDNRPVTVLTNHVNINARKSCTRWSASQKKHLVIQMPGPIATYNQNMGGIDLFDQMVACYRIRIRSKKWWWPLFAWTLNAITVNAWRIFQNTRDPTMSLLTFTREVTCHVLGNMGVPPKQVGRRSLCGAAGDHSRFDGRDHWPLDSDKLGGVCALCKRRTKIRCEKCDVALHVSCFKNYHLH